MALRCNHCFGVVTPATKQVLLRHNREDSTFYTSPPLCDHHAKHYGESNTRIMVICELDL